MKGIVIVNTGYFSPLGWGFNILFLLMWIWRVVFKYTYILRDGEMEVISMAWELDAVLKWI